MIDKSKLTFDSEKHIYYYDNKQVDSVTQILKPISSNIYKSINERTLNAAAERGDNIHFNIQTYNDFNYIETKEETKGYLEGYIKFKSQFNHQPKLNEYRVYSEIYNYAGTLDNLGTININDELIIDYKNISKVHIGLLGLQLSAYRQALKEEGKIVNQAGGLQLKKNGDYKFIIYTKEQLDEHFENFKKLLEMRKIIKFYSEN